MAEYDLRSLTLPVLSGRAMRLFAAALANPAGRAALLPTLVKQGGLHAFRALSIDEPPTFCPARPVAEPARESLSVDQVEAALGPQPPAGPFATVRDYALAYREGTATVPAVAEKVLAAIAASDAARPPLRAFIANRREDVMAQAEASAGRWRSGKPLSVFDGVPVAVKDELDQTPYPTTVGTTFLGREPAAEDAEIVARLRAAGALLIGKANMHEIGIDPCGYNAHYGATRNPYNSAHDPGGSSSGPAAAVAAGLCPVALGADGGGSIRIPAALCGVVGLKATYGRISTRGAAPLDWSTGHVGPLGATVEDVALAYGLIAGPEPRDPLSMGQPPVRLDGWSASRLDGLVLGIYRPWYAHAAPAIVAACDAMVECFREAGARVREIVIPGLDAMRLAHVTTILSEMKANMLDHGRDYDRLGPSVRISLALTEAMQSTDYIKAQRVRTRALAAFDAAFAEVDTIITPATAITAPLIPPGAAEAGWSNLNNTTEVMRFIFPGNLTGLPGIVFPVGYDAAGLPMAMQAIGRHWEEHLLLRVAHVAEQVVERRRPGVFFPIL